MCTRGSLNLYSSPNLTDGIVVRRLLQHLYHGLPGLQIIDFEGVIVAVLPGPDIDQVAADFPGDFDDVADLRLWPAPPLPARLEVIEPLIYSCRPKRLGSTSQHFILYLSMYSLISLTLPLRNVPAVDELESRYAGLGGQCEHLLRPTCPACSRT